jgi:hypothetical protein
MASTKVLRQLLSVAPLQLLSADSSLHVLSDSGDLEKKIEALSAQLSQLASASECCLNGRNGTTHQLSFYLLVPKGWSHALAVGAGRVVIARLVPVCRAQTFSVHLDLATYLLLPWSHALGPAPLVFILHPLFHARKPCAHPQQVVIAFADTTDQYCI